MSLLRADFAAYRFSPHTHDAFVIAVTEAGGAEISSRGITEKVGPATLFVSNPEEGQSARMEDGQRWRYRAFYLTRPAIEAVGESVGIKAAPYFMRNMLRDADLIERFRREKSNPRRDRYPGIGTVRESRRHAGMIRGLWLSSWRFLASMIQATPP